MKHDTDHVYLQILTDAWNMAYLMGDRQAHADIEQAILRHEWRRRVRKSAAMLLPALHTAPTPDTGTA